jgi:hypothetical protein
MKERAAQVEEMTKKDRTSIITPGNYCEICRNAFELKVARHETCQTSLSMISYYE